METFAFLAVDGERIFTAAHTPRQRRGNGGVLFVHPMMEEKLWAARATTRLARFLAAAGLPVLRFDFRGHGDSERRHDEIRMSSLQSDLRAAARHLRETLAVRELHLFGIRFGATLAAQFADELGAASLALVNPVPSGGDYLAKSLRSCLTTQLSLFGKVSKDRQALISEMRSAGFINVDGYRISAELYDEISALDFRTTPPSWRGPGLAISLTRTPKSEPDIDSRQVFECVRRIILPRA